RNAIGEQLDGGGLTTGGGLERAEHAVARQHQHLTVELFTNGIAPEGPRPVIEVDSDRAYVNDTAERVVYEIDYGDALRVARTLHTETTPGLMVEAGR
ncbi:MAG TPA: metal ABC transporter permease, partial [Mycobacterium sp.]|nr:metal ABC transporter permease [Mycobacterium sp.]